jgi:hypothetical protein
MDTADETNYACPFLANGCTFRAENFAKLKEHLLGHPKAIILFQTILGIFSGPIVKHHVDSQEWPSVAAIPNKRLQRELSRIHPIDYEEAVRYWSYDKDEDENEGETEEKLE